MHAFGYSTALGLPQPVDLIDLSCSLRKPFVTDTATLTTDLTEAAHSHRRPEVPDPNSIKQVVAPETQKWCDMHSHTRDPNACCVHT